MRSMDEGGYGVLPADQMRLKCRIDVGLHHQEERHAFNGPKA
jgi:hypothetical protein